MEGKTVIITGANKGIGRETAKELAKKGAKIILACRNVNAASKAREDLIEETKNRNIFAKKLDLSSLKSIRKFAEHINATEERLDVLIHNAGMGSTKLEKTEDDLELTMATNHFGPFLLTHLLIDLLKKSAPSRIVIVSSLLYIFNTINLNNLNPTSVILVQTIYFDTKFANICFTKELARRLEGTGVTVNCLHPGLVDTGIWHDVPPFLRWPIKQIGKLIFKPVEVGCRTSVFLASSREVEGVSGKFFMDCKEYRVLGNANSEEKAKKLWEMSEKAVMLTPNDPQI